MTEPDTTTRPKIKVRVAAIQYYEIELDLNDYEADTDLAELVRDYEIWPETSVDGDIGSIYVLRPGHSQKFEWWEEIEDDVVGRSLHDKKDHWVVWGDGTDQYRFESEDAAIRALGVVVSADG